MAVELAEPVLDLAIVFIIIGGFLLVANRFSIPAIPVYILAGILSGFFIQEESIFELARWGMVFLVFAFGVSVNFKEIKAVLWESEYTISVQILVIGSVSVLIAFLMGFDLVNSIIFTTAVILSSTIVGFKLKASEGRTRVVRDQLLETIQFTDDILAVIIILVLSAIFIGDLSSFLIGRSLLVGIILLLAGVLIYKYGFEYITRLSGDSEELSLMGSISLLIIFLSISEYFGISIIVGAFAAGLAINIDTDKNSELLNGIESIKYFFSAIFFAMLGGLLNMPGFHTLVITIILIFLVVFIKPFLTILVLFWEGFDIRTSALTGFRLNQVSEFTLFITIEAFLIGIIIPELFDAIILVAVSTMILSSLTIRREEQIFKKLFKGFLHKYPAKWTDNNSIVQPDMDNHIIIIGYGRQGKMILNQCKSKDIDCLIIDNDPVKVDELKKECENFVLGDAIHDYTMKKASIERAKIVISTIEKDALSQKLLDMDMDCLVVPKTYSLEKTREYLGKGAFCVNNPDILLSRYLIEYVIDEVI